MTVAVAEALMNAVKDDSVEAIEAECVKAMQSGVRDIPMPDTAESLFAGWDPRIRSHMATMETDQQCACKLFPNQICNFAFVVLS
jgi:hypothetical protein